MRDDSNRDPRGPSAPIVPPKPRAEVDDELAFHLERRIQKNIERGMTPEAARRAALDRFGDVDGVRQTCERLLIEDRRAEARRDWLGDLRLDVRFAIRAMLRAPLFSLLAIGTLALGIGANAAVFGVVKSVLLNSLPYAKPNQLMRIYTPLRTSGETRGSLSAGTVSDIRERQRSFVASGVWLPSRDVVYTGGTTPRIMQAMWAE